MRYTKQKGFEAAKKNCPIGGTAFDCMPTIEKMRKGKTNYVGYVRTKMSAREIYTMLNGCEITTGNPVIIFRKGAI